MSFNKQINYVVGGSLIIGAASALYYLMTKNESNKNIKNIKNDVNISFKDKIDNVNTDKNDKKEQKKYNKNTNNNSEKMPLENKDKYNNEILDINYIAQIVKIVINNAFEIIYMSDRVGKLDYNNQGLYIGDNPQQIGTNITNFKRDICEKLADDTYLIVSKNASIEKYNKSLSHHLKTNKYAFLTYSINKLEDIKKNFIEDKELNYNFDEKIINNFLKVISNLFYLTLSISSNLVKNKILNNELNSATERKKYIKDTYINNLFSVREKVIKFFNLEDDSLITVRTLLTIYADSMDDNNITKKSYENYCLCLDKIEDNMVYGIFAEELVDPNNINYNNNVLNEERDLERLSKNVVNLSNN